MRISKTKEGIILEFLVKTRSPAFKIVVEGDELIVYCTQEPVRGRVNKELVNEFSRIFRREVILVSGFASRQKLVLIKDICQSEAEGLLAAGQTKTRV
jgi:uncharacterized protein (TIGR00251 family)